jgi:hypothetical protein
MFKRLIKKLFGDTIEYSDKEPPKDKMGWKSIRNGQDGLSSYTEYEDHNGFKFKIYDLRSNPGFSGTTLTDE